MRGAAADRCNDARGSRKARHIRRAGIRPDQDHGLAARCQPFGTRGFKGGAPDRDAGGRTGSACNRFMNAGQPFVVERVDVKTVQPPQGL